MRVLLAGGGSGGSAAPVLAAADALRRQEPNAEFLYIGTTSGPEAALVHAAGFPYHAVRSGRLRRYATWRNLTDPALVVAGIVQAGALVRSFAPDVAFGAGGFATVPPLIAARLRRVPLVVHQQDVEPGLANRMLAPFAARVTTAFPETAPLLRAAEVRAVGNPVRRDVLTGNAERARQTFALPPDRPVLLVTGGGTGALRLNQIANEAARDLVSDCEIIHLTGAGKAIPGWKHPSYRSIEFLTADMADALAVADVVVTRAGLSALSEVSALAKAAIVVPMPASHQEANAGAFARHDAAIVENEPALTPEQLVEVVRSLLRDSGRRTSLGAAARGLLPPDAADAVAAELQSVSGATARSAAMRRR